MPLPLVPLAISLASEFAPSVVKWIAGDKAGEAAEKVVGIAKAVTGAGTGDEALELLRADPEKVLAFRQQAMQLEIELERIHQQDRASAREREIKTGDSLTPRILATLALLIYSGLLFCFVGGVALVNPEYESLVSMLIGALTTVVVQIFAYYFGSSSGSRAKQDMLDRWKAGR